MSVAPGLPLRTSAWCSRRKRRSAAQMSAMRGTTRACVCRAVSSSMRCSVYPAGARVPQPHIIAVLDAVGEAPYNPTSQTGYWQRAEPILVQSG